MPKNAVKFSCVICDFVCTKKSNYIKHMGTDKHTILTKTYKILTNHANESTFTCDCGNLFCSKHMNRHSHNCTVDVKTRRQKELVENNPKMEQKMVKI